METIPPKTGEASSTTFRKDKNGDKPAFKPRKGKVLEHTRIGVWDLYQERDQLLSYLPTSWKIEAYTEMWNDLPYLWKTIRDLASVAWPMLSLYLVLTLVGSLLPALTLWCVRASPFNDNNGGILTAFFQVFWTAPLDREYRPELCIPTKMFVLKNFCRSNLLSAGLLSTLVSSFEWSVDGRSAQQLVTSFIAPAALCPPPSVDDAGNSTRRTFSTPWRASMSPRGKTLPCQPRSTRSSRARVKSLPSLGQ